MPDLVKVSSKPNERLRRLSSFHSPIFPVSAILVIALIWAVVFFQDIYEKERTLDAAKKQLETLSATFEQYVIRTVRNADTITKYVKSEVQRSSPQEALEKLKDSGLLDHDIYEGVNILDEKGILIASTFPNSTLGNDFSDRSYFKSHRDHFVNSLIISNPVLSVDFKTPFIPITRRLNKPDGSFAGIVTIRLQPSQLTSFYRRAELSTSDYITVVGLDGIVLARRIGNIESSAETFRDSTVVRLHAINPTGTDIGIGVHTKIERIISYRTLDDYPLIVVMGTSLETVLREYKQRQLIYKWVAAIITLATVLVALLLSRSITRRNRAVHGLIKSEQRMALLATHDPLTQLPNRTLLEDHASHQLKLADRNGSAVAVLFVDLDNFKYHNDAYGHEAGDAILREVAQKVSNIIRSSDMIARIGGDEFVIILGNLDQPACAASRVAADILKSLGMPFSIGNRAITTTASIGISIYPQDGRNLQALLRSADTAVYRAKEDGRARFTFFEAEMNAKAEERLYVEEELRNAIALDQLELYYQPQIDLVTKRPSGVEALLRWNHPEMGMISPNDFIPIAERSGLILSIGEWVLHEACRQNREWQNQGLKPLPVAVNFSALQFRQVDVVESVAAALTASGLAPDSLEIELTETMIAGNPELIGERLKRLKALGITLALDDFGTGYSNLQYLKTLPLNVLKVDRSFVMETPDHPEASAIAKAIINMGMSLGLRVIAEGVETIEQANFLTVEGCSFAQGYLFSRPLKAADCFTWLMAEQHKADQKFSDLFPSLLSKSEEHEEAREKMSGRERYI